MHTQRLAAVGSVLWGLTIAVLMLLPSDAFPESKLLSYDKLAHIGVFAILSFLLCIAWLRKKNDHIEKRIIFPLIICLLYGSILEYMQQFVPGRMFDSYDFLANFTGGLVGVIIFSIFIRQKFVIDKLIL